MPEIIVLVDEKDNPIGYEEKLAAHRDGGKLHRAFSIFIFNSKNEALLQLRSKAKHHFQSLWSNPCCSHPIKGEKLEVAVHRKLKQELGFDTPLKETFSFVYKATDPKSGLTEHEFDHVFVGQYDRDPKPNPEEVDDWKWVTLNELQRDLDKNPARYTPWFPIAFNKLRKENLGLAEE
jgi:isopentenyl-diphosphate delta-isomerase